MCIKFQKKLNFLSHLSAESLSLQDKESALTVSSRSAVFRAFWAVTLGQWVCCHQPMTACGCEDYKNVVITANPCPLPALCCLFTRLCCAHTQAFPQQNGGIKKKKKHNNLLILQGLGCRGVDVVICASQFNPDEIVWKSLSDFLFCAVVGCSVPTKSQQMLLVFLQL